MNHSKFGTKKEQKVAHSLRNRGARVERSVGSRGAADLKAKFPSGTKWHVQVKATRSGTADRPASRDLGRLKQGAKRSNATPVVARVSPKGISYESVKGRTLPPPKRKK